jgi:uncharacterized protein (UPF0212 family)
MRALPATELLEVWERAKLLPPVDRALALLEGALDDELNSEDLRDIGLGRRDAWLLDLRELEFGRTIRALAPCPACGIDIESEFQIDDVRAPFADATATAAIEAGGTPVTLRAPTSRDLSAIAEIDDVTVAMHILATRCIVSDARRDHDDGIDAGVDAVENALATLDPQADVVIAMTCPNCGARNAEPFDIAEFLWAETTAWAAQTLADVDVLARAYGWPEREVLALSPWRRQRYVELVQS